MKKPHTQKMHCAAKEYSLKALLYWDFFELHIDNKVRCMQHIMQITATELRIRICDKDKPPTHGWFRI